MTNKEFIDILKRLEKEPTVYYSVSGGDWCKWNGSAYNMDCVCMIKGILWGFNFDKNAPHGGAIYGSNGVYDDGTEQIINRCSDVSNDFSYIEPGELLHMDGHVGVYVGNRQVIECTAGWEGGVLYSTIGPNGERTRNGRQIYSWTSHGKLPYITYIKEEPTPTAPMKHGLGEGVEINGVYVSSESEEMLTPAVTRGVITKIIEGARNPYLLDNGNIGWVNDDCIVENKEEPIPEPTPEPVTLSVGDIVVPTELIDYNGTPLVQYDEKYEILELNGDRAVLGAVRGNDRPIWAAMNINNIRRA